jgi:hypothetical protein
MNTDWFHKLLKFLDYERGKIIGFALAIGIAVWLFGCQPKTASLINPDEQVTARQFEAEYRGLTSQFELEAIALEKKAALIAENFEAGTEDINEQVEFRQKIVETLSGAIGGLLSGNPISWGDTLISTLTLLTTFVAGGGILDAKRKNAIIANTTETKTP